MNQAPDVLWLSVSPHLKCFDQRLLSKLVKAGPIRRWEYLQTIDEPCCIEAVVEALHEHISDRIALENSSSDNNASDNSTLGNSTSQQKSTHRAHKLHLLGHGVSGIVGLMYARRYPQHVASLTLLSVNALPAVNWQAHYYALRQLLPCSRNMILAQMTRLLFGEQPVRFARALSKLLARDLDSNLTLHSLAHHTHIAPDTLEVPLLVCNGELDGIARAPQPTAEAAATTTTSTSTNTCENTQWETWLKPEDRLWLCPGGNHFFHFNHYTVVANRIMDYWQQVALHPTTSQQVIRDTSGNNVSSDLLFTR
ncbi:MAG: alpha/beta hydrolase [Cyanobacteria bacterium P01_F01_bin.53]